MTIPKKENTAQYLSMVLKELELKERGLSSKIGNLTPSERMLKKRTPISNERAMRYNLVTLDRSMKCFYDGLTIVIWGEEILEQCVKKAEDYGLKGDFDVATDKRLWSFTGRYENFDIKTVEIKGKRGIMLGGSIHKYVHGNNHSTYLWSEHLQALREIEEEFGFDGSKTNIWVAEFGANLILKDEWQYPTHQIPENVIYVVGRPKKSNVTKYARGAVGFEATKGERKVKIYDKGVQEQRPLKILRVEERAKSRDLKKYNLATYNDLKVYGNHQKFAKRLVKTISNIILVQNEIFDNIDLSSEDKMFMLEFNSNAAWVSLRKKSDYQFRLAKQRYLQLIDKYCPVNYAVEIYKMVQAVVK